MIETTSLYGGEVICHFEPLRHKYTIITKGRRYKPASVTRIVSVLDKSGPLTYWAVNQALELCKGAIAPGCEYAETYLEAVWEAAKKAHRAKKEEAGTRGKVLHALIEQSLGRSVCDETGIGSQVRAWLRERYLVPRTVEGRVYSRRHRFSGTFDCIADSPTGLALLDWKSSKSIYPEFRLQTAAYQYAHEEEHPDQPIVGRYLVHISDEEVLGFQYLPRPTYRLDFAAFAGAQRLFNRIHQIEQANKKL